MGLLQRVLDTGATLIDYEPVVGADGLRLVHFGRFAGLAGAIDGLWGLGQRLGTPLERLGPAWSYPDLASALDAVAHAGDAIRDQGFGTQPLVIGVVGDGNVARGAQEVLDVLGAVAVAPSDLAQARDLHTIYRVTFREADTVDAGDAVFDVADYRANPGRYHSTFGQFLPRLTLLVNAMYWDERAPRLVSRDELREPGRLQLIADLSCDIDGGVEATVRSTTPDDPIYVYDPATGDAPSGFAGPGVAVLAVDHLPCELPLDASRSFSDALEPWVPALARFAQSRQPLPAPWRNALIAEGGELAPAHAHLVGPLRGHE
jgi:alpha-aminoadipic semialdehyde synthase